ncbi:MAG: hypothetical protein F2773_03270, partial [Actinobacteria bacterium]|nr:hypothetical protein [Actinomycetota bacterium]
MTLPPDGGDVDDREDPMPVVAVVRRGVPQLPTVIEGPVEVVLGAV